jgi:6-hydroxycyclohex-1-ene-1-carbonyl-CoA dehydrogenase
VLELVLSGKVEIASYVETHALDEAAAVFEAVAKHAIQRRVVLQPNGHKR